MVTAVEQTGENIPSNVVDDDPDTFYLSKATDDSYVWIALNLGGEYSIGIIEVLNQEKGCGTECQMELENTMVEVSIENQTVKVCGIIAG